MSFSADLSDHLCLRYQLTSLERSRLHLRVSITKAAVLFRSFSGNVARIPLIDPCLASRRSSVLAASK